MPVVPFHRKPPRPVRAPVEEPKPAPEPVKVEQPADEPKHEDDGPHDAAA